ncbi:hypothetical protein L6259_03025 [Candidatus Parcubacteria bacterium]|nr:hypothetical protein [Patescibacteria group bacterium]MCG2694212.1 hypothetical protein [Candidatus Parcubacteria bacterium]
MKIKGLLHDHIDGCAVLVQKICEFYKLANMPFPFSSIEAWIDFFQNPQEDIIKRFSTINNVLQTAEALEELGYAYGKYRAEQGYVYVEAKFAPQYHTHGGLSMRQATEAMRAGLSKAEKKYSIRILPQICIGRETDAETGIEIAKICLDYGGEVVMDLACDEANHPPEKHLAAYKLTYKTCVRRDCHTGEWVLPEPKKTYRRRLLQNIRTAVYKLKADGISHAIPLVDDPRLVAYMADNGIRLSGCPAAYRHAGLIKDIEELKIPELLDAGIIYTLNTDDDLFLPPMPEVIASCQKIGLTKAHWEKIAGNVWKGAFAPDAKRYLK